MKKFTDSRKDNAIRFMKEQGLSNTLGGKWTNGKSCKHILKADTRPDQTDVIRKYNLLPGIDPDMLSVPHKFAHHLTSSQIMCYNFFRPLITDNGTPTPELIYILAERGVGIKDNSICEFESINPIDNTSYDLSIESAKLEIKFTEHGFGKAKNDGRHKTKFKNIYIDMIKKCKCLNCIPDEDSFFKFYQLFRNVLHIDDNSKYAIFVFPKGNMQCCNEFQEFVDRFINDEYMCNIQAWHWEDLLAGKEDSIFYKKYLR